MSETAINDTPSPDTTPVTAGELAAFGLLLERTEKALMHLQGRFDAEVAQAVTAERERILAIACRLKTVLVQDNDYRVDAVPFGPLHDLIGSGLAAAPAADRPPVVCLCGSTRFYDEFQQANYDLTMQGVIVLSVGFYPHAKAEHGHGEGVGHDSAEKTALDELHKRKIDLADEVFAVSDESGYFGDSTAGEIAYAVAHGKPVRFAVEAACKRAREAGLIP